MRSVSAIIRLDSRCWACTYSRILSVEGWVCVSGEGVMWGGEGWCGCEEGLGVESGAWLSHNTINTPVDLMLYCIQSMCVVYTVLHDSI